MKFKKVLAGLAAVMCCLPCTLAGFAEETSGDMLRGDINLDNRVDIMDIILLNKAIYGKADLSDAQRQLADVDQNGTVDASDSLGIMKYVIRLIDSFDTLSHPKQLKNLSSGMKAETVSGKEADAAFISGQTAFYLNLFQHAAKENTGENVLVSPYSAMQALAMTANGADGQTKSEMEQVLGGLAMDDLNQYLYAQRISQLNEEVCKLNTANSVWYRDDTDRLQVNPDFLQINANYYDADAFSAPFDDTTVKDINNWVNEKTDAMIPELLDSIPKDIVMYLINAVAFDARWIDPYSVYQVREQNFTAADGTTQTAQMMYDDEEYLYLQDENATGFYKYYKGGKYAFMALLPNEDISIEDYISDLTPDSLYETLANPQKIEVHTGIPKFSYDYEILLNDTLIDMGMPTAFTEQADFSKTAHTASGLLYIDYVLQKTHIELNEIGTKAAAVTVVAETDEACIEPQEYKTVFLDHPFVYGIVDMDTHLPIFLGALMSVE